MSGHNGFFAIYSNHTLLFKRIRLYYYCLPVLLIIQKL